MYTFFSSSFFLPKSLEPSLFMRIDAPLAKPSDGNIRLVRIATGGVCLRDANTECRKVDVEVIFK